MRKNKKNKVGKNKKNKEKLYASILIIGISFFLSVSYCHKRKMLKDSKITTCVVIGFNEEPGITAIVTMTFAKDPVVISKVPPCRNR